MFLELFTSCVAKPIIERGATSHQDSLAVLNIMKLEIDKASDDPANSAFEDAFESVLAKIKGLAASASREFGVLGSKKSDAEFLRANSDSENCGLYVSLLENPFYNELVKEYWATIEYCNKSCPRLRLYTSKQIVKASVVDVFFYKAAVSFFTRGETRMSPVANGRI